MKRARKCEGGREVVRGKGGSEGGREVVRGKGEEGAYDREEREKKRERKKHKGREE